MKMTTEHYRQLKTLLLGAITTAIGQMQLNLPQTPVSTPKDFVENHKNALKHDVRVKDINVRLRWDLMYLIPRLNRVALFDEFYEYLHDEHIDTALKQIIKNLTGD